MPNQELHTPRSTGVTYWEGAVDVSGRSPGGCPRPRLHGADRLLGRSAQGLVAVV